jgi:uncharacterized membrane protein
MTGKKAAWIFLWLKLKIISAYLLTHLRTVYLLFAIFSVILIANINPAFQVPDETNHFLRAEQISRGVLVASFVSEQATREHRTSPDGRIIYPDSGGYIGNRVIIYTARPYEEIKFRPDLKLTAALIQFSKKFRWNQELGVIKFNNTAFYPPAGYVFSALGILIGKWTNMSILDTLIFSRIINGIGCALICFFALGLANRCRLLLFFILLLPLTLSLFASVSQDAVLISVGALMAALIDHIESGERKIYENRHLILLIVCISVLSSARPPYFLLIAVFLFLHLSARMKLYSIAIPFAFVCIWGLLNIHNYSIVFAPAEMKVNARLQMAYVMSHPFRFMTLFLHFRIEEITTKIREFIGVLGWLNLFLPDYYYKMAYFVFFLTGVSTIQFDTAAIKLRVIFVSFAILTFLTVLATQYVTWMPLESPSLGGFQSRYLLPVFAFLAVGFAGFRKENSMKNWQVPIFLIVVVFPLISQVIIVNNMIARYYLG